jgi:hypothetical protein
MEYPSTKYARANEWQSRRNELSHDWLKNTFMPALGKFSNVLEGRVRDDAWITVFITEILPQWPARKPEFEQLNLTFEIAMSPQGLLTCARLPNCSETTRNWLRDLVHTLWSNRINCAALIVKADKAIQYTDSVYWRLIEALPPRGNWSPSYLRDCREHLLCFRQSCQHLGDALTSFPREVLFT